MTIDHIADEPVLALSIRSAARMVGMSVFTFRHVFLNGNRLQSVHVGPRCRIIDAAELRVAYFKYVAETRDTH